MYIHTYKYLSMYMYVTIYVGSIKLYKTDNILKKHKKHQKLQVKYLPAFTELTQHADEELVLAVMSIVNSSAQHVCASRHNAIFTDSG